LELDHVDPALKVSHRVWSWARERREAELAKCQVLCHDCHVAKTAEGNETAVRGERNANAILTSEQVLAIRAAVDGGATQASMAAVHGLSKQTVSEIINRKTWAWL
jgi:hypothetical protein